MWGLTDGPMGRQRVPGAERTHGGVHTVAPWTGEAAEEAAAEPLPSLDVFLSRHTSEDNASFREIMEVAKERGRARHAWLYQAEEEFEKVPGAERWCLLRAGFLGRGWGPP